MKDVNGLSVHLNSVVQIHPGHDERFGGCLMIVTEIKSWGAVGFVQVPGGSDDRGAAFFRCPASAMSEIGPAAWARQTEPENETPDE